MTGFFLILTLTFIFVACALLGIGIGWLLTGKAFKRGSCGGAASEKRDGSCGKSKSCSLCQSPPKGDDES